MGFPKRMWIVAVTFVVLACALAGCAGEESRTAPNNQQGVSDVLQQQTAPAEQSAPAEETPSLPGSFVADKAPAFSKVDYDLTTMGADMVYATVNDMMINTANYEGKIVRMGGPYYHAHYDDTNQDYFFVVIKDATACCSQGLEFIWGNGSHVWPNDYPEDGHEVVVTGKFETYNEDSKQYVHLVDASIEEA